MSIFFIIFYWIWSNIKMGKTLRPVNKPTQNWDKLQHLAHLWILTCSWQLSHCIWVIKTLPRHFKKNHHQGGSPCPAPSEWVEVKNQAWRTLWGRWRREARWRRWRREAHLNQFSERGGPTSSDFATVTLPVVWPSDALTRSLTLVVDKWMECDENRLK